MIEINISKDDFRKSVIAQDDDNDYSESGWVCFLINKKYYLARYSHCSCYGTYTSLSGGDYVCTSGNGLVSVDWEGTKAQLKKLVKNKLDPAMPTRTADEKDYDYDHLMRVYYELEQYFNKDKNSQLEIEDLLLEKEEELLEQKELINKIKETEELLLKLKSKIK